MKYAHHPDTRIRVLAPLPGEGWVAKMTTRKIEQAPPRDIMVTTMRLYADQWSALRAIALAEQLSRPGSLKGRADASELVREILDEWLARNKDRGARGR